MKPISAGEACRSKDKGKKKGRRAAHWPFRVDGGHQEGTRRPLAATLVLSAIVTSIFCYDVATQGNL
jgi:hypothetical protein